MVVDDVDVDGVVVAEGDDGREGVGREGQFGPDHGLGPGGRFGRRMSTCSSSRSGHRDETDVLD